MGVSKRRFCPALEQEISPSECGEQRQSRLACPPTCEHNPFTQANYDQLLKIEDRVDDRSLKEWLARCPNSSEAGRNITAAQNQGVTAAHAYFAWQFFFALDAAGSTFAQRWEQAGLAGQKNDERVLWRGKSRMQVALLEIHRIDLDGRIEAVDLLSSTPTPLTLQDRSMAAAAVRFGVFLTWIYPLPHFWRLSGSGISIPDVAELSPPEIVREIVRHLGGPATESEMRRWLAEHFARFDAAQQAVRMLRRRQMMAGMDAKFGRAIYELRATFAQCRKRLDASPEITHDEIGEKERTEGFIESFGYLEPVCDGSQPKLPGGRALLGRILMGRTHWRLEAFGAEKLSRLRDGFEKLFGERVRFCGERIDDMGARMNAREPAVDEALVPPRLLENPDRIVMSSSPLLALPPNVTPKDAEQAFIQAADRDFLNQKIPALDDRTPREAALDPSWRLKLIHLVKRRVRAHDERNLSSGRHDDINWLIEELDLKEINFPPPPRREPQQLEDEGEGDFDECSTQDDLPPAEMNRPPASDLPKTPLSRSEVNTRLDNAMKFFATPAEAERELALSGSTLMEVVDYLVADTLSEKDFNFAMPFIIYAWFSLVPVGCRAPQLDFAELEACFRLNLVEIGDCLRSANPRKMVRYLKKSPQPELCQMMAGVFFSSVNAARERMQPAREAEPIILALVKAIVEAIDRALRSKGNG
jgi:hypothetical protein